MEKIINYLPFMQILKEGRAYIMLLPFNCAFDEIQEVLKEFSENVEKEKAFRAEITEKAKLEAEMNNGRQEAAGE